ncbi:MAG: hypothetical protein H0U73_02585 [Tatlockia sp.]|nr:hypothetical protein [Tatlockia sp.]
MFLFDPKEDGKYPSYHPTDNLLLEVPYYAAATAVMLLSLPFDLLIGLIALPVAALHDLGARILSAFEEKNDTLQWGIGSP